MATRGAGPFSCSVSARLGDAFNAADAGADHHAGVRFVLFGLRMPAGIFERLTCRAHRKDDELVDLALLLRLHPLVGIVGAVGPVARAG